MTTHPNPSSQSPAPELRADRDRADAATTPARPRALFVTLSPPFPPNIGGSQRTDLILRALAERFDVDALILDRPESLKPGADAYLRSICKEVHYRLPRTWDRFRPWSILRPFLGKYARSIAYRLGSPINYLRTDPDLLALVTRLHTQRRYTLSLSRYLLNTHRAGVTTLPNVRHLLDADDVDTTVLESQLHDIARASATARSPLSRLKLLARSALLRRHLRHVRAALPALYRQYHHITVCSHADESVVRALLPHPPPNNETNPSLSVLPNIAWISRDQARTNPTIQPLPSTPNSSSILVVGSWSYAPNTNGLTRFLTSVWPLILAQRPDAKLLVAGGNVPPSLDHLLKHTPAVQPLGFVNAMPDAYRPAAFAIAPVYTGGGTKLKVAEAAAHARACVCTDHSYRGYERIFSPDQHLLVAHDDQAMAQHCLTLLNDPARCAQMGRAAAHQAAQHLSWPAFRSILDHASSPTSPAPTHTTS